MSEEIWKDVKGYEGLYQVSNHGRVRSLDHEVVVTRVQRIKGRILKTYGLSPAVTMYVHGRKEPQTEQVARLVLTNFVRPPAPFERATYRDGTDNPHLDNLEWR